MKTTATEIIVLRDQKYGNSSKILKAFSKDLGKISIMVKGALRPGSSTVSVSSVFSHSMVDLNQGKSFYYIKNSKIINSNYNLRNNYDSMIFASFLVELVDKTFFEGEKNIKVFDLLGKALSCLGNNEKLKLILMAFELKFISFVGYRPNLDAKGNSISFSIEQGGITDKDEIKGIRYNISQKDVYYLNKLLYTSLDKIDFEMDDEVALRLQEIIINYLKYNLEIDNFNSLLFIN
ncbi:DNA repair protein RecO [Peptoniphilus sp. ING2-D1G]|nr:DNA repair protein RecO [Peptoniphilus sp. ING2-D1G]